MKKFCIQPGAFALVLLLSVLSLPGLWAGGTQEAYFSKLGPATPDPVGSLQAEAPDWYKDMNFYHIWVPAFSDSDGNGVGDIPGITSRLDYLKSLGVSALWLSPFCTSSSTPDNIHNYDVVDLYTVDPRHGTVEDVKTLLKTAHEKGLRVIMDFVPNHLSWKHPWFLASQSGDPEKRDWFLWSDKIPSKGWKTFGGGTGWRDGGTGPDGNKQYYYGIFWERMPDLNYRNPQVRQAMAEAARFWLDLGFDGFRMDAVRYLFEDPTTGENGVGKVDLQSYAFFQKFRKEVLDPYGTLGYHKFMVAENWTGDRQSLKEFLVQEGRPGFHMTLDFNFGFQTFKSMGAGASAYGGANGLEAYWTQFILPLQKEGGWNGTFLTNHDNYQARPATAFAGEPDKIKLAFLLQYTGPGTPFWYYGNEVDMPGEDKGDDRQFRQPMNWDSVAASQSQENSTWNFAKTLMHLRASRESLRRGDLVPLGTSERTLKAFLRTAGEERTLVVFHLGREPLGGTLELPKNSRPQLLLGKADGWKVENSTLVLDPLAVRDFKVFSLE